MFYHLAQLNVARMLALLDDLIMTAFVVNLERINALADPSPGFVWRLQTESGNATDLRSFEDDLLLINMSVWDSLAALKQYVYQTAHAFSFRRSFASEAVVTNKDL